ncbi:hypothetical protein L2E82_27619 [Cichorium intybus]|uniref:Uncharacterized protein n=1 Tax=Cichorium intybus TaxID=13427 RepID=A0ACB9CTL6_CICIN|nr:hypothetical protein L2E82_27619 [Cichorium intybus]
MEDSQVDKRSEQRLLVYEFMANGSLHQHLHGNPKALKSQLDWVNSSSPLAELPAGTLGYLDPKYYRIHHLTTISHVYSFGVLLLEILSGRKAIDMKFEEGNIVEWAVPLIKADEIHAILDPALTRRQI